MQLASQQDKIRQGQRSSQRAQFQQDKYWYCYGYCWSCVGIVNAICFCRDQKFNNSSEFDKKINNGEWVSDDFVSEFISNNIAQLSDDNAASSKQNNEDSNLKQKKELSIQGEVIAPDKVQSKDFMNCVRIALRTPKEKFTKRDELKDNISHIRISRSLLKLYKKLTDHKLPSETIDKFYHRKDYFIVILSYLEKKGKIYQGFTEFKKTMVIFNKQIQQQFENQMVRLNHFRQLINSQVPQGL